MSLANKVAFTTVAELESELGLSAGTTTALLERLILAASEAIEKHCNRRFRQDEVTEKYRGTGTNVLVLDRTPIVEIDTIEDDGEVVDADTYRIDDEEAGTVWGDSPWRRSSATIGIAQDVVPGTGEKLLEVTYTGGYVLPGDTVGTRDLPHTIEEACLQTAAGLYAARGSDRRVVSESFGDASATYAAAGGVIPPSAERLLRPFVRVI